MAHFFQDDRSREQLVLSNALPIIIPTMHILQIEEYQIKIAFRMCFSIVN